MTTQRKVLVTGATGNAGSKLVRVLVERGHKVRAGVRSPEKASVLTGAEIVPLDYARPETFAIALAGTESVFLVAPPLDPEAPGKLRPLIEAAQRAGVHQLVFLSAFGANHNEQAPLRIIEHAVMDSGISYVILRPNFFMENFSSGFLAPMIRQQGVIALAAGDGKTSFIACKDIAEVAAAAIEQGLEKAELELTGPEALDHYEVAQIISEVSGRTVRYQPISEQEMLDGMRQAGLPEPALRYLAALYGAVRAGYAAPVTDTVTPVLGRPSTSFREFALESALAWRAS